MLTILGARTRVVEEEMKKTGKLTVSGVFVVKISSEREIGKALHDAMRVPLV